MSYQIIEEYTEHKWILTLVTNENNEINRKLIEEELKKYKEKYPNKKLRIIEY